ncbi:MAG: hypothetical protein Q7T71_03315 [Herbiconiux sp.]|nr:hypothetical protein [Herbiconiux sp.]
MTFGARLALAIVLLLIGLAVIALTLTLEIMGAPPWLHLVSWIGGGLTAFGLLTLVNTLRSRTLPAAG